MASQRVKIVVRRRVIKTNNSSDTKTCPTCHGSGKVAK